MDWGDSFSFQMQLFLFFSVLPLRQWLSHGALPVLFWCSPLCHLTGNSWLCEASYQDPAPLLCKGYFGGRFFVLRQMWTEQPLGTLTEQISNTAGHQLHFLTGSASHCLLSLCPSQMVHLWAWALLFSWLTGSQAAGFVTLQATTLRTLHAGWVPGGEVLPTAGERLSSDLLLLTPEGAPTKLCHQNSLFAPPLRAVLTLQLKKNPLQ